MTIYIDVSAAINSRAGLGRYTHSIVNGLLQELEKQARHEDTNLVPHLVECAKAYVSIQEVCDVLREVFGEYEPASIL